MPWSGSQRRDVLKHVLSHAEISVWWPGRCHNVVIFDCHARMITRPASARVIVFLLGLSAVRVYHYFSAISGKNERRSLPRRVKRLSRSPSLINSAR